MEERRAVATRLERFLEAFIHGKTSDRLNRWRSAAEQRLAVKLSVSMKSSAASVRDQIVDAVRSLASFLVAVKQIEPPEAVEMLKHSRIFGELPVTQRSAVLTELAANASFFFEHPDVDPDGDLADFYLDDLAAFDARLPPRTAGIQDTLEDVAAYLRRQPKKIHALLEKHYNAVLAERLPESAPQKRFPIEAARAALDLLADPAEQARFLYGPVRVEWPDGVRDEAPADGSLWLLGVDRRLLLFAAGPQPRVVWRGGPADVRAEPTRQFLMASCGLTGGQWHLPGVARPLGLRITANFVVNYGAYFGPLFALLGRPAAPDTPAIATG
jgi:hypothetical protein